MSIPDPVITTEDELLGTFTGGQPEQIALRNFIHTSFNAVGGGAAYPQVTDHASLPDATTVPGEIYVVQTTTGIIGFRKLAGLWRSDGASWLYLGLYGRNASEITNVPAGTVSSTDVQAAITELDDDLTQHKLSGGAHHPAVTTGTNGFMSAADKTKLDGIATAATANSSDATLLARANHTGTQLAATISDFTAAVNLLSQPLDADLTAIAALTTTAFGRSFLPLADAAAGRTLLALGTLATQNGTFSGTSSGTNTGDQTSIVGLTGTKAQFNTAVTDGDILYVGDVTAYTDEQAQDAVGLMLDASLTYVDATPLLQRAALTGAITAPAGSNATSLGSFTTAALNTALSDADIATGGGTATGTNTGDQTTITGNAGSATILQTGRTISMSGDVTWNSGSFNGSANVTAAGTIGAGVVTLAKQANLAANSIQGNNTGAGATPLALTATQTTAMLDAFTGVLKGLAPASGGGTVNFLRADGTWTVPAGGVSDGDKGDITVSASGATWLIDAGVVDPANLSATGTPSILTYLRGDNVWATPAGTGDFVGPASSTDNAIVRFDLATGKIGQNSAATVSDDGIIRSATNSGANAVSVPLTNWVMLTANFNLNNVATEQKLFNTTANGALTLPTGVYEFEAFIYLLSMSATSGNFAFDPVGAGTAITDRWGQQAFGVDAASPLAVAARGGSASVTQQSPASIVTAATGTGAVVSVSGMFRISTGGTIIPSITLVTAAAAIAQAGTWFRVRKIGESSETSLGAWT